jgi:hypothetical protein
MQGPTNRQISRERTEEGFLTFDHVDLKHPLFTGLFEDELRQQRSGIESPRIIRSWSLGKGRTGSVLIDLSDGTPFLSEFPSGRGRVLVFAVDPGVSWSDFAIKGIYAPLLHRCATYLATGQTTQTDVIVGEPVTMVLRIQHAPLGQYALTSPSGLVETLSPRVSAATGLSTFTSSATHEVGIYFLNEVRSGQPPGQQSSGSTLMAVPANVDPAESVLRQISSQEFVRFFEALGVDAEGITQLSAEGDVTRAVIESRFGVELWRYLIGAAILLALCEMVVARVTRNERVSEDANAGDNKVT